MELSEREESPRDFSARTLAIVVARCDRTAEVLHRQLELVADLAPQRVLVIEADALRGIDYAALIDAHIAAGIGATLAFFETAAASDGRGTITVTVDGRGRVLRIGEAGKLPRGAANDGRPRFVCAGAYVLDRELLVDCLEVDAAEPTSGHDFRADVLPVLIRANGVAAHRVVVAERPPVGPPAPASGVARRAVGRLPHGR